MYVLLIMLFLPTGNELINLESYDTLRECNKAKKVVLDRALTGKYKLLRDIGLMCNKIK